MPGLPAPPVIPAAPYEPVPWAWLRRVEPGVGLVAARHPRVCVVGSPIAVGPVAIRLHQRGADIAYAPDPAHALIEIASRPVDVIIVEPHAAGEALGVRFARDLREGGGDAEFQRIARLHARTAVVVLPLGRDPVYAVLEPDADPLFLDVHEVPVDRAVQRLWEG